MKLKWQKEMKWLLLAALAFLFLFERSDTLTVQDGYVRLCRRTWWFYKREVKSAEVSSIENVTHKHVYGGGVKGDSLVLKDKGGKIFYELLYRGFVEFTTWKRAHNDQKACKSAIEGKGRFSRTESITLPIPHVALVGFLLVYWYKRSWRIHDEREDADSSASMLMRSSIAPRTSTCDISRNKRAESPLRTKGCLSHAHIMRNKQQILQGRANNKRQVAVMRRKGGIEMNTRMVFARAVADKTKGAGE